MHPSSQSSRSISLSCGYPMPISRASSTAAASFSSTTFIRFSRRNSAF